jgi:amino acid transporter
MPYSLRRALFGSPLATSRMTHERLGTLVGLAVFASDALSSVAYATEEILLALVLAGTAGLPFTIPVGIAIGLLILIVAFSYRQTIIQYPDGGGAYIVAHDNLGENYGLVAAAALLIDYTLTVAVSVTAGVAAVISAFPGMEPYRIGLTIAVILFVAFMNLRGVRESGLFFAIPTYAFIISMLALLVVGLGKVTVGAVPPPIVPGSLHVTQMLTWFLVLRAFASGCAALTGIEAVANGVQAFKHPAPKHAVQVLTALAFLLLVMFVGITWLARSFDIIPSHQETVVSQIAEHVFGRNWMYYVIQVATSIILFLAANTSFAGFPRLSSLLARDGYLPRQLANLGDRLVFNNGILLLAAAAIVLVLIFGGLTHALIPLYAVGVFLAFTLSQAGMVVRWHNKREKGWKAGIVINSIGALTTLLVLMIILMVKFTAGAWMVVILLPVMVMEFRAIHRHYNGVADLLRIDKIEKLPVHPTKVIVPVAGLHRGVLRALRFAAGLNTDTVAIHVGVDEAVAEKLKRQWAKLEVGVPLVVLDSPYRSLVAPLLEYVDQALAETPDGFVAVVIPEFVPQHWRHSFLHNQSALLLEFALRSRPNAVLISIRYLLGQAAREARLQRERETCRLADLPATKPPTDTPPATDAPSAPETPAEAAPEPQPVEPPPCDESVAAG